MAEPDPSPAADDHGSKDLKPKKKPRWRLWLRALHRDAGNLAIGLTFVYAASGLAVNHIKDWDPNFQQIDETHALSLPVPQDDQALANAACTVAGQHGPIRDVYRVDDHQVDVVLDKATLHVDTKAQTVRSEGQKPRFLLRVSNWLHLNRGKKAWQWIADGYAVFLLFLAGSGLFMLPLRQGLLGRGGLLTILGAAVPVAYVVLSGGP